MTIYCLCGRENPEGMVSKLAYSNVQYSEERCVVCAAWQPIREAIQYLRDAQGRVHDADAWHSLKAAGEYLWQYQPTDADDEGTVSRKPLTQGQAPEFEPLVG